MFIRIFALFLVLAGCSKEVVKYVGSASSPEKAIPPQDAQTASGSKVLSLKLLDPKKAWQVGETLVFELMLTVSSVKSSNLNCEI